MRRALPSPSGLSSSSTPRRPSAPSCPTPPPPAATAPRSCASSTRCRPATRTRSPPQSTGSLATTSLSTPLSRTSRPRSCSPTSASSSPTCGSPLWPRRRLPLASKLWRRGRQHGAREVEAHSPGPKTMEPPSPSRNGHHSICSVGSRTNRCTTCESPLSAVQMPMAPRLASYAKKSSN